MGLTEKDLMNMDMIEIKTSLRKKLKQAIRENPITYQYATLRLKQNVDLAILFLEQGGSFSLISKYLRKNKKICDNSGEKILTIFNMLAKF